MILHQRQVALLRFQQQEREMQMKRMQMMGQSLRSQPAEICCNQVVAEPSQASLQGNGVPYGLLIFTLCWRK